MPEFRVQRAGVGVLGLKKLFWRFFHKGVGV